MYRNIAWFFFGYLTHKHVVPISGEVLRRQVARLEAAKAERENVSMTSSERKVEFDRKNLTFTGDYDTLEQILARLNERIKAKGWAPTSELLDLLGLPSRHIDEFYGWHAPEIIPQFAHTDDDEWTLRLPKAQLRQA